MIFENRYAKRTLKTPVYAAVFSVAIGLGIFSASPAASQAPRQGTPAKPVPKDPESARPGETLSEKLDRSKGIIRPPSNTDPEISKPAPAPNPGTTPVIPPPGTPGGDPSVQPK
jgi:hypothetical protein